MGRGWLREKLCSQGMLRQRQLSVFPWTGGGLLERGRLGLLDSVYETRMGQSDCILESWFDGCGSTEFILLVVNKKPKSRLLLTAIVDQENSLSGVKIHRKENRAEKPTEKWSLNCGQMVHKIHPGSELCTDVKQKTPRQASLSCVFQYLSLKALHFIISKRSRRTATAQICARLELSIFQEKAQESKCQLQLGSRSEFYPSRKMWNLIQMRH